MKLNEKIIKLRKDNNLSQEDFGNKLNISRQAVSKWENEETKPEIDKIRDISKIFNVSCDYLLNDEIDDLDELKQVNNEQAASKSNANNKKAKRKNKTFLNGLLILILIYMIFCIYKFITFYKFYAIANSFSEENYAMFLQNFSKSIANGNITQFWDTTKVGNKKRVVAYFKNDTTSSTKEDFYKTPLGIMYTDSDKKECYSLNYDEERQKYIYTNSLNNAINEEEKNQMLDVSNNDIKTTTLTTIPSNFKDIFKVSINPLYYYVSISQREYCGVKLDGTKFKVQLNNDYLLSRVEINFNNMYILVNDYSYDYVQDHFTDIKDPLEVYNGDIIYENIYE